jgi:RecA/RadA recombinase
VPRPKKIKAEKNQRVKKEKKPKQEGNISFFQKLVKATGNELAKAASNGIVSGDIHGWIDTGVYILNAQLSGSLFGGIPDNKIVVFAGPEATGKTFFILSVLKFFLKCNPTGAAFLFESESAISRDMLVERGIDVTRVFVVPVSTIQEWKTQSLKVLRGYKDDGENRPPMMFILDSLGMLSTNKEMEDSESGSDKADMTRTRLIKAAFRTLTLKLGVLGVPFLITNHTYETQGMFATKVMSGGCLIKGTKIITSTDGKTKNIDEMCIGDKVQTLFGEKNVTNTFNFNDKDIFKINLEDGNIIECSGNHKFLVNGKWVDVYTLFDDLKVNQNINVSDIKTGDIDVFRQQIQENLL